MKQTIEEKKEKLARILSRFDKLAVALSGGVDSALLLASAYDILRNRLVAITARSPLHPEQDIADAARLCADLGVSHWIVDSTELTVPDFLANTPMRCYTCKMTVFGQLLEKIRQKGIEHLAHGANADDLGDYRPGLRAARELGVSAPLMEAGLTKEEIRSLARARGLGVWNKPAMACLASRIPYGSPITIDAIGQVRQAENALGKAGFSGYRIRHHGNVARIEVLPGQMASLIADPMRERIVAELRKIGFDHVCVDLEGYVSGSLNRALDSGAKQP